MIINKRKMLAKFNNSRKQMKKRGKWPVVWLVMGMTLIKVKADDVECPSTTSIEITNSNGNVEVLVGEVKTF